MQQDFPLPRPNDVALDDRLLELYVAGECSLAEQAAVERWIRANPTTGKALLTMRANGDAIHAHVRAYPGAANAEQRLVAHYGVDGRHSRHAEKRHASKSMQHRVLPFVRFIQRQSAARYIAWGLVGSFLVLAGVTTLWSGDTQTRPSFWRATSGGAPRTYTTGIGRRATVQLQDGTRVVLAPQSVLVVNAAFGNKTRDVSLTGQAHFDVTSAASTPFLVHTGAIATRVVGTDFTVRHYPRDREVLVAVRSGKVTTGRRTPVVLTENMVARLTDSTAVVAAGADLREYMEWTDGRFVFTKVPAAEVMTVLGRWYGLTFQFADSALADRTITGVLDDRFPREEVLQNLQLILGVRMKFEGNVVTLVSARASKIRPIRRTIPDEMTKARTEVGQ